MNRVTPPPPLSLSDTDVTKFLFFLAIVHGRQSQTYCFQIIGWFYFLLVRDQMTHRNAWNSCTNNKVEYQSNFFGFHRKGEFGSEWSRQDQAFKSYYDSKERQTSRFSFKEIPDSGDAYAQWKWYTLGVEIVDAFSQERTSRLFLKGCSFLCFGRILK